MRWLFCFPVVVAVACGRGASSSDDVAVMTAAVEHLRTSGAGLGPEVAARSLITVRSDSAPLCSGARLRPCVPGPSVALAPEGWTPSLPPLPAAVIEKLVLSFRSRNARPSPLPALHMKDVEVRAGTSTPAPVLSISVPGYADAAIALIFVSVECGDRCGSTWLLLLDRGAGTWRVVAGRTLTMS